MKRIVIILLMIISLAVFNGCDAGGTGDTGTTTGDDGSDGGGGSDGTNDIDSDNDGTIDSNDQCPNDQNKIKPGACGCGVSDKDSDGDKTPDCNDLCPKDPKKIKPGKCGCGKTEDSCADSGGAGKTVYTSESAPDLDISDRIDFKNELIKGGYKHIGDKKRITFSQFNALLKRSDIKTIYHGSHGNKGVVCLMDKNLSCSNSATYTVENVIYATCLSLTTTCWKNKMGPTSKNILGYTKVSYDGIANTNAKKFAKNIVGGKSYIKSWYASNTSINQLKDRWCAYTREGNKIVEYSARSGNNPRDIDASFAKMDDDHMIFVNKDLINDTRNFASSFSSLKNKHYEFEETRNQTAAFFNDDDQFLVKSRTSMSTNDILKKAQAYFNGTLPEDAVFEGISMIEADNETVAYRVRYIRRKDGMNIRGNMEEHHIELLINNGEVVAVSKIWPDIIENSGNSYSSFMSVNESVKKLSSALSEIVREPVNIVSVSPCYGNTSSSDLVPAHCFEDDQDLTWVVNASTGEFVE